MNQEHLKPRLPKPRPSPVTTSPAPAAPATPAPPQTDEFLGPLECLDKESELFDFKCYFQMH